MNTSTASLRAQSRLATRLLGLMAVAAPLSLSAQTTGFLQTGSGPYDYNTASNWVGNTINGVWDSSLTLTAAQVVTFASDTPLSTGLSIGYTGNVDLTLRSSGTANQTITLGGDILIAPVNNRTIFIGSTAANQGLNVNLGGADRSFNVATSKALFFYNTISNGNINITGPSSTANNGIVRFVGANGAAANSNISVALNSSLYFDSSTSGVTGTTRAQNVTLKSGGKLVVTGNGGVNSNDTISGGLTIDGSAYRPGSSTNSIASVTVTPSSKNALLTVNGNLTRTNNAVVLFRGTNLGVNTIASATGNSANIQIQGTTPTLVGGGGALGSTNISIIPWALGGTTSADNGSTFVTYTAANGVHALTSAEFATGFGNATDNVKITAAAVVNAPTTVNSLVAGAAISGTDTITVTSGAVFISAGSSPISAGLDFGAAEGVLGYARGNAVSGVVAGTGGLTVYGTRSDESIQLTNSANTYSGNTTVLANLSVVGGALPSGARTGDVYVYGNLQLSASGFNGTINGLYGNGTVSYGNSGSSSIAIGDNNATSTFTGTINANNKLTVSKIGSGTLTLVGAHTWSQGTNLLGGTLEVNQLANGGVSSGIGNGSNAASSLVINGGALKYSGAATSTDRLFQVGQTTDGGVATLNASGTGPVNFTNTGALTYGTAGTTGAAQTRSLVLTGTNTGDNTLSALIGNNGVATNGNSAVSVTKSGDGTWVLSGANTYTGATTINAGTLALGAADRIADASNLILAGGTFATRGFSETLGTLTVTGNSFIDLGSGASALVFAASNGSTWSDSVSLSFVNYTEGFDTIRFGIDDNGLTISQLSKITINGIAASIDANGYLTASAIPEPSAFAAIAGLGALAGVALRRRRRA